MQDITASAFYTAKNKVSGAGGFVRLGDPEG
jgi:hypothetical protein